MNSVPYKGEYFPNPEWAVTLTEAQFCEHEAHQQLTKAELKEAYRLCKAAAKASAEAQPETT